MRVAVIGLRSLIMKALDKYIPKDGAIGVDSSAKAYAKANNIKLTELLPKYEKYGKFAPLKRNISINKKADIGLCFFRWKEQRHKICDR